MTLTIIVVVAVVVVTQLMVVYRTVTYLKEARSQRALLIGWVVSAVMTTINAIVSLAEGTYFLLGLLPTTAIVWCLATAWIHDALLARSQRSTKTP